MAAIERPVSVHYENKEAYISCITLVRVPRFVTFASGRGLVQPPGVSKLSDGALPNKDQLFGLDECSRLVTFFAPTSRPICNLVMADQRSIFVKVHVC